MTSAEMLPEQLQVVEDDCQHLLKLLESPNLHPADRMALEGRFKMALSRYMAHLQQLRQQINLQEASQSWQELAEVRSQTSQLFEDALSFAAGTSLSRAEMFQQATANAQVYAQWLANMSGLDWTPAVVASASEAEDRPVELIIESGPEDRLGRLPLLGYDLWHLPLLAERWGYVAVKNSPIGALTENVNSQAGRVKEILSDQPPAENELDAFLPEVRELASARQLAQNEAQFSQERQATAEKLFLRQKVHLWRLAGAALAAYLVGPTYVCALLFLQLDPTQRDLEGANSPHGRYQPSDMKRAALAFQALHTADALEKPANSINGPYSEALSLLETIWQQALDGQNNLGLYQQVQEAMQPWGKALLELFNIHFGLIRKETAQRWQDAMRNLFSLLENGSAAPLQAELASLLDAAWWCRVQYPQRAALIAKDASLLLSGEKPLTGLLYTLPIYSQDGERLVHSRIYDLESALKAAEGVFRSPAFQQSERELISGRFFRLLSEQEYTLGKMERAIKLGNPWSSTLTTLASQASDLQSVQQELLDFLGGTLIRNLELDKQTCQLADGLLRGFSRSSGISWGGRAIPGQDPLFSQATDLVHVRFPDWDIWNLPLMAHEFGHVTAFASTEFEQLLLDVQPTLLAGHPQAAAWGDEQKNKYLELRRYHLHEFFADAYATYVQGPAFVCDVILLNFNPAEAYLERGRHPSHAERVELVLTLLNEMNNVEKTNPHQPGPYAEILVRLQEAWDQSVTGEADTTWRFHKLKATDLARKIFALLERYYRLGAQFPAKVWQQAEQAAPLLLNGDLFAEEDASLRSLLSIAWAARLQAPDRYKMIGNMIKQACLGKL